MEEEQKPTVTNEVCLPTVLDSTFDTLHVNKIKQEFSVSDANSRGRFVGHAVESINTGMKLKMEEEENPEAIKEVWLPAFVDSTSDARHLNDIKKEFSLFELDTVVKHRDTRIQSMDLKIKSELSGLKCDIQSGLDDTYIQFERLVSEEVHIKNNIEESPTNQTIKKSAQVKTFSCNLCNKKFEFKTLLYCHLNKHSNASPLQCNTFIKCSVCDYRCLEKSELQQHILNTHTGEKLFKCDVCDYKCIHKSTLQHHIKTHLGEKLFKFSVCIEKPNLQQNMETIVPEKLLKCSECDYRYIGNDQLQLHAKTHTEQAPFKCSICDKSYLLKSVLQRHIKIHTGEKSVKCNVCDYRCMRKHQLQRHVKTHTGDKPFKCIVCNYRCTQKGNLKAHMKAHTPDKPFKCKLCNYYYKYKNGLEKHNMETHI